MKRAIYAGSFNPLHQGHLSIITKALKIVDYLIIVVANNPEKKSAPINMRYKLVKDKLRNIKNVEVQKMDSGLLAHFANRANVNILIRSARNISDFEFELMMAIQNKRINNTLETILIMPDSASIAIRSSIIPKL